MILDGNNKRRPKIDYPCDWHYKIIGKDAELVVNAAEEAAEGFEFEVTASNVSKKGNYFSINLKVHVKNEAERNLIFGKLEDHEHVVMVL